MVLANGSQFNILLDILICEEIGTLFVAKAKSRNEW
jgi:Glutamate 5-kinase